MLEYKKLMVITSPYTTPVMIGTIVRVGIVGYNTAEVGQK